MSEPHDVVKLLVARMESNPEEFTSEEIGRWAQFLDELMPFVTEEERVMLRKPMHRGCPTLTCSSCCGCNSKSCGIAGS